MPNTPGVPVSDPSAMQRTVNASRETVTTYLHFPCPECGHGIKVSAVFLGQPCACPHCTQVVPAPKVVPGSPSDKILPTPTRRRSRGRLFRRLKRFIRSRLLPSLIAVGVIAAIAMVVGIGMFFLWRF